jgi:altronate dehydratase
VDDVALSRVAVLPEPGDNVGVVTRTLPAGTRVRAPEEDSRAELTVPHTVLEGHRVVVRPVKAGEPLLSWNTPFAIAERDLAVGDYVCTPSSLAALRGRGVEGLPAVASARNVPMDPYRLDAARLHIGEQATPIHDDRTFMGFERAHGVAGTRNHIVVIAASSRGSAFVTELARRFERRRSPAFDGVVAVAHTEGGEDTTPNNLSMVLSVLAGFMVHPNVGAVMLVDEPDGVVDGGAVQRRALELGLPPVTVPHAYFSRRGAFTEDIAAAAAQVEQWIEAVGAARRTPQPVADLRIALQCGGSDAFSGISANPLAGAIAREVVRRGGGAVLAETDELIGAEGYVLENVRSEEVALRFQQAVESFKERVSWHGHTAEGNPSGGNVYRGLYNIVLKSVGAARKRDRAMRLDHVVSYGEPLPGPGFVFMDSPGNDLESVAGQVASGSTVVLFTTGNGSITNFPFVPTLKVVTTTDRFELLRHEMDIDAGRYLTGTPMQELTDAAFNLTVDVASGRRTAGEKAGHSQVSLWREWRQSSAREGIAIPPDGRTARNFTDLPAEDRDALLEGVPLVVQEAHLPLPTAPDLHFTALRGDRNPVPEQVALLLPTSLCSGQVALQLSRTAEEEGWLAGLVSRVVALPHTEGCGVTSGAAEETFVRTMIGHLVHPHVRLALLLEHGCEKTHNDYFRHRLVQAGADPDRYGWASIQRDGGIAAVTARVRDWVGSMAAQMEPMTEMSGSLGDLALGLEARGPVTARVSQALALVGSWIVRAGGTVLLSSRGSLVADEKFRRLAFGSPHPVQPTLAHGQAPAGAGWHVMRMPGTDWLETATGLAGCGAQLMLAHVCGATLTSSRMLPLVQVSVDAATVASRGEDLDAVLTGDYEQVARGAVGILQSVASRQVEPRGRAAGDVGFQITRGLLGTSM